MLLGETVSDRTIVDTFNYYTILPPFHLPQRSQAMVAYSPT